LCDCDLRDIKTKVKSTMQQLKTVCLMKTGVYWSYFNVLFHVTVTRSCRLFMRSTQNHHVYELEGDDSETAVY